MIAQHFIPSAIEVGLLVNQLLLMPSCASGVAVSREIAISHDERLIYGSYTFHIGLISGYRKNFRSHA